MITLAIQIRPEAVAPLLAGSGVRSETVGVMNEIRAAGATLKPMHPGTHDPDLRTWFFVEMDDFEKASALAARLMRHAPVLSAYPKPPDELP